jgi:hypothetical protein
MLFSGEGWVGRVGGLVGVGYWLVLAAGCLRWWAQDRQAVRLIGRFVGTTKHLGRHISSGRSLYLSI